MTDLEIYKKKVVTYIDLQIKDAEDSDKMFGGVCKVFANDAKLLKSIKAGINDIK
jgi:hypothetical protein